MRKIALRGLLGQKKGSLLLWSVVTLAFLFLTLSTTLISSLQVTDANQRISTYGSWQVMADGLSSNAADRLASGADISAVLPMVNVSGADYFSGDNSYYLSLYSPELEVFGQFRLKEGRWPESRGEVALEYARMAALGLQVGDNFTVLNELSLPISAEALVRFENRQAELVALAKAGAAERYLELWRSGNWQGYQSHPYGWSDANSNYGFFFWWDWMIKNNRADYIPIAEMDEAQVIESIEYYLNIFSDELDLRPYMTDEERSRDYAHSALLGVEDVSVGVNAQDTYLALRIPVKYTVCGVVETYSDRWDSGQIQLPSGFITQESYELYLKCQQKVLDSYPDYEGVKYDCLVLSSGGESLSARQLWDELRPSYNEALDGSGDLINAYYAEAVEIVNNDINNPVYFSQFGFDFQLCDEDAGILHTVRAWLAPQNAGASYKSEALLLKPGQSPSYFCSVPLDALTANEYGIISFRSQSGRISMELPLEGAVVAFDYDGHHYELPLEEFKSADFTVDGMSPVSAKHVFPAAYENQNEQSPLRLNHLAYPSAAEGSGRMLLLVTVILFVTTVCAVFQIFFTQMRRRLRRIVLMKSIGAESGQIGRMMVWEFLYFWLSAMPVGALLGLCFAKLSLLALSASQGRQVIMSLDPATFAAALVAGSLALLLGMAVPMIMAVGVPLTGRTVRKKPLPPPKKETRQDFVHITLRSLYVNRGRTLGSAALCVFMMLITVLCLFLGFRFMAPYREAVERDGKPDYMLSLPYSVSSRQRPEFIDELNSLGVCQSVEVYQSAGDIFIDEESVSDSLLLETAYGETSPIGDTGINGYPTKLYSLSSEDELFKKYSSAVTEGQIDPSAFDSGRQVLLLIPQYADSGVRDEEAMSSSEGWERLNAAGIDTSYYAEYDGIYDREAIIRPGDALHLAAETISVNTVTMSYYSSVSRAEVTVGAIIYYFPEQGVWPVSGSREGYQIVCSPDLVSQLLPNAIRTRTNVEARAIKNESFGTNYGNTDFYLTLAKSVDPEDADTALLIYARSHNMDIEFYRESSEKLLQDGVNNVLLCCLLGLTAVLLALLIFANTIASDIEQERRRIGILQSLGVSQRELILRQLYIGLSVSGAALILANILLWTGVAVFTAVTGAVPGNLLWAYPVAVHILLCLLVTATITLLYIAPMNSLKHSLPIENIKSGK